jgi:HEPN domain-containing protein
MATHDEVEAMIGQWLAKAESDLKSASCIVKLKKNCPTDTVCFHAQQCIEKYIKALLVLKGTNFPKTHDIAHLMALLPPSWRPKLDDAQQERLTDYATVNRYLGDYEPISLTEAKEAVKIARQVKKEIQKLLEKKPLF